MSDPTPPTQSLLDEEVIALEISQRRADARRLREKADDDPYFPPRCAEDYRQQAGLHERIAGALEAQAARVAEQQAMIETLTQERDRARRQYERLALCPDHRDKANGRCLACQVEQNVSDDCHHKIR